MWCHIKTEKKISLTQNALQTNDLENGPGPLSKKKRFHVSSYEYYTCFNENSLDYESTFGSHVVGFCSHSVRLWIRGISSCWWNINLLMLMNFVGSYENNQTIWINVRLLLTGNVSVCLRLYLRPVFIATQVNEKLQ